jgi:hypothetical protein
MVAPGFSSEGGGMPTKHPAMTLEWLSLGGFTLGLAGFGVSLAAYTEPDAADGEPAWWPAFERDFRDHVRERARAERKRT